MLFKLGVDLKGGMTGADLAALLRQVANVVEQRSHADLERLDSLVFAPAWRVGQRAQPIVGRWMVEGFVRDEPVVPGR